MAKMNVNPNLYVPPMAQPGSQGMPPPMAQPASLYAPVQLGQPQQPNPYAPPPVMPVNLGQDRTRTAMDFAQPNPTMQNLITRK